MASPDTRCTLPVYAEMVAAENGVSPKKVYCVFAQACQLFGCCVTRTPLSPTIMRQLGERQTNTFIGRLEKTQEAHITGHS